MNIADTFIRKPAKFIGEVRGELHKVNWSTRQEVLSSTLVVIASTFLVAVFIGVVDLVFSKILSVVFR
jgi:preprotein translocase subunit SecE